MPLAGPIRILTVDDHDLVRKCIAGDVLVTAPGTVKAHVQSILSKLGAKDRMHAVTIAFRRGIIHLHSPEIASIIPNG